MKKQYSNESNKIVVIDLAANFYDPHGVYALTATLRKKGFSVDSIRNRNARYIIGRIKKIQPAIILYSSFSNTIDQYVDFDRLLKNEHKCHSIIGGPGPTFSPSCINESTIDSICVGEGDISLPDFVSSGCISIGNIFQRNEDIDTRRFLPFADINNLPFPDRSAVYAEDNLMRDMPSKQFMSGRGCPYSCTYCFNHALKDLYKSGGDKGAYVRKKDVDYLLEEITLVRKKYQLKCVVFNDDTFILNRKWLLNFCELFPRTIGLPYTCNIRANLLDDEAAYALKESGCIGVNWSIESGDATLRDNILCRKMSNGQIVNAAEALNKHGIKHRIGNVIGLPGETTDQMLKTLEINIKSKPMLAVGSIFLPFPGLQLTDYAVKNGYYDPQKSKELPKSFYLQSILNFTPLEHTFIIKLSCLFSIFVAWPFLYFNTTIRKVLFRLPAWLLHLFGEVTFIVRMRKLYSVKMPIMQSMKLAIRHLQNQLFM